MRNSKAFLLLHPKKQYSPSVYEITLLTSWLEVIWSGHCFFHYLLGRTAHRFNSTTLRGRSFNIRTNYMVNREMIVLCLGKADEGSIQTRLMTARWESKFSKKAELMSCWISITCLKTYFTEGFYSAIDHFLVSFNTETLCVWREKGKRHECFQCTAWVRVPLIHSPQTDTRIIRLTKSLPESTFICNHSDKPSAPQNGFS